MIDLNETARLINHLAGLRNELEEARTENLELKKKLKGSPWSGNPEDWLLHAQHQLAEAQEAAQTYHEAWQDAAVYWKGKVAALESEVAALRAAVGPKEDPMDVVHDAMEGDWH